MKVNFQYAENVKSPTQSVELFFLSDPDRIQTCNPQSRNLMRYSVAPRGHFLPSGATTYPIVSVAPRGLKLYKSNLIP